MEPNNQLKWTYKFENKSVSRDPDWNEVFETTYEGKPVSVNVRVGAHPIIRQDYDGLSLRIYSDSEKKDFVGLIAGVGHPELTTFLKPLEGGGHIAMDPEERPDLEDFVAKYKPIFESQRDLRRTYEYLL